MINWLFSTAKSICGSLIDFKTAINVLASTQNSSGSSVYSISMRLEINVLLFVLVTINLLSDSLIFTHNVSGSVVLPAALPPSSTAFKKAFLSILNFILLNFKYTNIVIIFI